MKKYKIPLRSKHYKDSKLSEFDFEKLPPDTEVIIYRYGYGDYEGHGYALIKNPRGWIEHNLGHCSCYGPTEELDESSIQHYPTIALLEQAGQTEEHKEEYRRLIKKAKELGYE